MYVLTHIQCGVVPTRPSRGFSGHLAETNGTIVIQVHAVIHRWRADILCEILKAHTKVEFEYNTLRYKSLQR